MTLLVVIFTFGLSDEKQEGLSAYSIFNRGFEKLMGSVDADSLLAQHVGGGLGGGGMMNRNDPPDNDNANPNGRRQEARQQRIARADPDNPQNDNNDQDDGEQACPAVPQECRELHLGGQGLEARLESLSLIHLTRDLVLLTQRDVVAVAAFFSLIGEEDTAM